MLNASDLKVGRVYDVGQITEIDTSFNETLDGTVVTYFVTVGGMDHYEFEENEEVFWEPYTKYTHIGEAVVFLP